MHDWESSGRPRCTGSSDEIIWVCFPLQLPVIATVCECCKVSGAVDRENRGIVGVLADADSIPTSTPLTASASPLRYRLVPAPISLSFAFVLDRTPQLPRRPPSSLSTPRRDIYDAHSLIKGPRLNLAAALVASRRLAGPPLLDSSLRVLVSPRVSCSFAQISP
ncbi:hypothetical protein BC827DRAFT_740875 [Russula dissimulans]|nr:hypothetical protein BC827DRAFT_740875 [Russula dissimulans]